MKKIKKLKFFDWLQIGVLTISVASFFMVVLFATALFLERVPIDLGFYSFVFAFGTPLFITLFMLENMFK